ncbi:MAG: hypothetical protein ABIW34_02560 [Ginsengibacter sp.]
MDTKPVKPDETVDNKHQAESSDNKTEMQQHEKLIDPGNEHNHHVDDEKNPVINKEAIDENKESGADADAPPY